MVMDTSMQAREQGRALAEQGQVERDLMERGLVDLGPVNDALHAYTSATGQQPCSIGGWEVEDPALGPPPALLERLLALAPQPRCYAYGKDFQRAKAQAANVFQASVCFNGKPLAPAQVAVLQNSSQGLLLALTALREQGVRRAIIAAPTYYATVSICQHLGLETALLPAADYLTGALDVPRLIHAAQRGQSVLILTNPAYSVGVEYPQAQLRALVSGLPAHTWLLLDETRLGLSWQDTLPWYQGDFADRALILRSPSKIFLLNGLKSSFLLGAAPLIRQVERLSEALVGSAAGNAEEVALAYLDAWRAWLGEHQQQRIGTFRTWKNAVLAHLRHNYALVGNTLQELGFTLSPVDSGPYLLAGIQQQHVAPVSSVSIARTQGVLLMTSNYFYHCSNAWWGFRVNLCGDAQRTAQALRCVFPADRSEVFQALEDACGSPD
jgi:histidinol-phosphate/aromatic aminotransferase/cobyric acid decarboxylase-like protein